MNVGDFDMFGKLDNTSGDFIGDYLDKTHRNNMKEFLRALGLISDGLSIEDIENLSKKLMDNYGKPDKMIISPQAFEALKKFNDKVKK